MQKISYSTSFSWVFTISILLLLILPHLLQEGMFMDAVIYTSVAKNLSNGIGTFWHPYFDPVNVFGYDSFHEQPPLVFGIVSLFFSILGEGIYTERIYVLFTALMNLFLIQYLWKILFAQQINYRKINWLPILFWIIIPVCFWSYSNNMNENTMSIFVLLSVIFILKAVHSNERIIVNLSLGAVSISLAFLCKGFPALFPLSIPFLYWWAYKRNSFLMMCKQTFLLLVILFFIAFLLYLYPPSCDSLKTYLFDRAFYRIQNVPSVDSRFFIVTRLLSELLPLLILTVIFFILSKKMKYSFLHQENIPLLKFFLLFCLSGTLPLMLTKVQNGFYMVATLPYWGIFFAILLSEHFIFIMEKISESMSKKLFIFSWIFFTAVVIFSFSKKGEYNRDKEILHDIKVIGKKIPKYSVCYTPHYQDYINTAIHPYFVRYFNIYLSNSDTCAYVITNKNAAYKGNNEMTAQIDNLLYFNFYKK